jgi:hypothetical protein
MNTLSSLVLYLKYSWVLFSPKTLHSIKRCIPFVARILFFPHLKVEETGNRESGGITLFFTVLEASGCSFYMIGVFPLDPSTEF